MNEAMLSVEQALEQVLTAFRPLEVVEVPLLEALGCAVARDVHAREEIPLCDNSAMDGYAVRAADTAGARPENAVRLQVIGEVAAGQVSQIAVERGTTLRIMTGAPIPPGADAIVKVEDTRPVGAGQVEVLAEVRPGQYIRPAGEDVHAGDLVLPQGTPLRPQEIGMLAALGYPHVPVHRRPRVAILATGDELVEVDEPLTPGQVRNANGYSNAAQVLRYGGIPIPLGVARDRMDDLTARIRAGLEQGADLLLTSGGVSMGKFDLVKQVLAAEGEIHFWRVRMKPGKPLAFGHIGGVPFLGLPGNPVSAMVSFETFARPAILKMLGWREWERPTVEATLLDKVRYKDGRRHYLRARIVWEEGAYHARLTGEQGAGILSSMVRANGLVILPEEWGHAPAGAQVQAILWGE